LFIKKSFYKSGLKYAGNIEAPIGKKDRESKIGSDIKTIQLNLPTFCVWIRESYNSTLSGPNYQMRSNIDFVRQTFSVSI